jgi:glycosyltransferase involved in cell wall biosynthesis
MKKLILFTSSFPFGKKETYLETEIEILSKAFDQIDIYPHYYNQGNKTQRTLPKNIKVHEAALPISKFKRLLQSLKGIVKGAKLPLFFKEFFQKKVYRSRNHIKSWLMALIDFAATVGSKQYHQIKREKEASLYFYWGFGWCYVLLNFDHSKTSSSYIRLHGSEVYLERSNGYIPLRKPLFNKTNYLLPISDNLARYLQAHYLVDSEKILVSRLGVLIPENFERKKTDVKQEIHLASCSNMIKLKRIDFIIEALKSLDGFPITWIHFGDGPEMIPLQKLVDHANYKTIKVEFVGRKPNSEILDYYKKHQVDAFINVSKHEGVPVSIMEAMSCKIPSIATNVGATSELVNDENGILLDEDITVEVVANAIKEVMKNEDWKKKSEKAYEHCNAYYNAKTNYKRVSQILKK